MIDELNQAIAAYQTKWDTFLAERKDKAFFDKLKPTSVGWKTEDLADFDQRFAELRGKCDQIHLGWINERWLATMHLKNSKLVGGISIIKLMQRRPNSSDPVELDHLDFYAPDEENSKRILDAEPSLKWTDEKNGHCKWLSVWFAGTEAKIRANTVLDVAIDELNDVKSQLLEKDSMAKPKSIA